MELGRMELGCVELGCVELRRLGERGMELIDVHRRPHVGDDEPDELRRGNILPLEALVLTRHGDGEVAAARPPLFLFPGAHARCVKVR
jgi:hypothetical protein